MKTTYFIAKKEEYPAIFEYLGEPAKIRWPVILAKRDGKIVGVVGTMESKDAVIAGPFKADSPFIAMKVGETYDNLLKSLGLKHYLFGIGKDELVWLKMVRKLDIFFEEIGETEKVLWFRRRF